MLNVENVMKINCFNIKNDAKIIKKFKNIDLFDYDFVKLIYGYGENNLKKISSLAKEVAGRTDLLLVIGVGGSVLGTRAFTKSFGKKQVEYIGYNFDWQTISQMKEKIKGKNVALHVVSKSGKTLETIMAFDVFEKYAKKENIFVTSVEESPLWQRAKEKGYSILPMDKNLGGRFSTMSNVGFFAMAYSGIAVKEVYHSACNMIERLNDKNDDNIAFLYANARLFAEKTGKTNEIITSFTKSTEYFMPVAVQLFAESLGKSGKGLLPSYCIYSEGLHSLGQFVQEGRACFMETFITPKIVHDKEGQKFDCLNSIARESVVEAHRKRGFPIVEITLDNWSCQSLAELLIFFQVTTIFCGEGMKINFLNQNGVEGYKNIMLKKLSEK